MDAWLGAATAIRAPSEPATGLGAVRNAHDQHPHSRVVERIQDAIVTDAELPQWFAGSAERLASPGVGEETALEGLTDAFGRGPSDGQKVASRLGRAPTELVPHLLGREKRVVGRVGSLQRHLGGGSWR
jgi:hypothetical protein